MPVMAWGEWKPDVSSYQGSHTQFLNNVLPRGDGYGPIQALSAFSSALAGVCRGAFCGINPDGTIVIVAGTATALYKLNNTTLAWADVTRVAGGAYAVPTAGQWQFTQVGADIIAVNGVDVPQRLTVPGGANFAALAGSPPIASYVTSINQFLILSGLSSTPFRVAWSARSDITGWTAGTNGSDVQDFTDGGVVRGVAGGEFGWVFQDNAIRRMTFNGDGVTNFEFDRLTEDKGLRTPYSIIRAAEQVFFISSSGFEQLMSDGSIVPIGKEKFDRTFFAEWDSGSPQLMFGVHDPQTSRVFWFYKTSTGAAGLFNRAIVYDWQLKRAAPFDCIGEAAASLGHPGTTLEGLDTLGFTSIDAMPTSLDDFTGGGDLELGVFDSAHKMGFLGGANLEATLETSRTSQDDMTNKRVYVRACRPDTDAITVFGSVLGRQRLADNEFQSTETAMTAVGFTPHQVDLRLTGFRNRIPAATQWTYSIGVEPELVTTGQQ